MRKKSLAFLLNPASSQGHFPSTYCTYHHIRKSGKLPAVLLEAFPLACAERPPIRLILQSQQGIFFQVHQQWPSYPWHSPPRSMEEACGLVATHVQSEQVGTLLTLPKALPTMQDTSPLSICGTNPPLRCTYTLELMLGGARLKPLQCLSHPASFPFSLIHKNLYHVWVPGDITNWSITYSSLPILIPRTWLLL